MKSPLRPTDPRELGGYQLLSRLGEGGMGTVYLGRSQAGRLVAVKVIRPDLSVEDEFRGRFRDEVNRARQVPPFCTAEVLDADPEHPTPYLVVEYVDGPSLAQVVGERGPLTDGNLHGVAIGVATALAAIHGAGVIHRDLKPSNVLFALGSPKVIDFGIARALDVTSQHTRTNQMVGTVSYMAPERFDDVDGRPITPAADVFAWGAVVTYAGTGRTPFAADSPFATAARILTQPPELTGLSGPLRELVALSLAKEPADRPTAHELLNTLLGTGPRGGPAGSPLGGPLGTAELARRPELQRAAQAVVALPEPAANGNAAAHDNPAGQDGETGTGPSTPSRFTAGQPAPGRPAPVGTATGRTRSARTAPGRTAPGRTAPGGGPGRRARLLAGALVGRVRRLPARPTGRVLVAALVVAAVTAAGLLGFPATRRALTSVDGAGTITPSILTSGALPGPQRLAAIPGPAVIDRLDRPGQWRTSGNSDGTCAFAGQLVATARQPGVVRCPGPADSFPGDQSISVDVTIIDAGSCALIWFRFVFVKGYRLSLCPDALQFAVDNDNDVTELGTTSFDRFRPGQRHRVDIELRGTVATVSIDGAVVTDTTITDPGLGAGQVILGVTTAPSARAAKVAFARAQIRSR